MGASSRSLPGGVSPSGTHVATIRHYRCQHCGRGNEIRLPGLVPSAYYNAVADFCRAAAGDEFVLLPVATLEAMGEERQRLKDALEELGWRPDRPSGRG